MLEHLHEIRRNRAGAVIFGDGGYRGAEGNAVALNAWLRDDGMLLLVVRGECKSTLTYARASEAADIARLPAASIDDGTSLTEFQESFWRT